MESMSHPLYFLCPSCHSENTLRAYPTRRIAFGSLANLRCTDCHTRVVVNGDTLEYGNKQIDSTDYYQLLMDKLSVNQSSIFSPPEIDSNQFQNALRVSQKAMLRQGNDQFEFVGYHRIFKRIIAKPRSFCQGYLILYKDRLEFLSGSNKFVWHARNLTCITTNGHYFEFKIKHQPFYQIKFVEESHLKYEIIIRKWLGKFYSGSDEVIEFQPRVMFSPPEKSTPVWNVSPNHIEKDYLLEEILLSIIKFKIRMVFRLWIKVKTLSRDNWNISKTGFTILNHQSAFDPFIVGAFLDRKIAFLTKSSSFNHGFPRFFLRWLMGVPTTRHQTDPEVIYLIRKMLKRGIRIGIFAEGERTWDGKIQPFKMSLVKLLMASREAITPVILKNAFHFWPRWAKFPRRAEVQIQVGAPFCLIPDIYSVDEQREFLEEYFRAALDEN